tara:strand:- start:1214 stop:1354 length:141 start_codon:yes stop_codon:yes gene_type:complete
LALLTKIRRELLRTFPANSLCYSSYTNVFKRVFNNFVSELFAILVA